MIALGNIMSTSGGGGGGGGGYHEYIKGCPVHWKDTLITLGDIMNTSGDIMIHVGEQVDKSLSIYIEIPDVLNVP